MKALSLAEDRYSKERRVTGPDCALGKSANGVRSGTGKARTPVACEREVQWYWRIDRPGR